MAATFTGMFTWQELIDMDVRQRSYWIRQVDAIRRQHIAMIAHGVSIGMAEQQSRQKAMDELELSQTFAETKRQEQENRWSIIDVFGGGGKGV